MKPSEVFIYSLKVRDTLKKSKDNKDNLIDDSLLPVLPFRISNKIKLIILGQDPTVKNSKSRYNIEYTLNLDKDGSLKEYITKICSGLDISFENIYATNLIKYFYNKPPADTPKVMQDHLSLNLGLLKEELEQYNGIPVIVLGQPVLQLLTSEQNEVKHYWGYNKKSKSTNREFEYCHAADNRLGLDFFPFPHQPSLRKVFYKNTLNDYLSFVKYKSNNH